MGMVVRTNTMALNAYRQLGMNNSAVAKSLEKLSSGFRINRAGDDAAGLAISEKMKAQIKGLETASANAQDGISLIQTAEGNLNEVHDMLNRMVELATKSANGTYTSQERSALQDEVDSLLEEIDRISKSANFNGTKLLNGTMGLNSAAFTIGNSTDAVKAKTKVGDAAGTITTPHVNTGTTQAEVKPQFTIDLADLKFEQAADGTTAGTVQWDPTGITVGGTALSFVADAATATNTAYTTALEGSAAADKDTNATLTGAEIVTKLTAAVKHAVIDDEVFSVSGNGTTLTLTWAGKVKSNKLDATAKVDDDTVTTTDALLKGNVEIADATGKTGGSSGDITVVNRDNCHLTNIQDAKVETTVVRTGATFKLTADMLQVGAKLKIGDTEFTFVDKKETGTGAAGANEIALKDIGATDDEKLEAVTRQLSNKGNAVIKDADGGSHNFVIGRGNAKDTIEIEEEVQTNPDDYSKFTADDLKKAFSYTSAPANAKIELTLANSSLVDGDAITIGSTTYKFTEDGANGTVKRGESDTETLNNLKTAIGTAFDVEVDGSKMVIKAKAITDSAPVISGGGLTLQIGDTADSFNKMNVAVADMSAKGLGLEALKRAKGGILTESSASNAIKTITTAINTVSTTRAGLGALQNRLEHTINNLDVAAENLSAANSRIRDTDMAKEMMNYTKMNVLVQSAQAMLAQANQQPQSVLQLLQ